MGPCSIAQPQPPSVGRVGNFDLSKWQISLSKVPPFTKFDGTTQHYRAWKMQLENWLSTVNADWIPVLELVQHMPYEIKESTYQNTTSCLNLTGDNLRQLSSVMWTILAATLHEWYLPQLEALSGGKGRNGFEVVRKLWIYHGRGSIKQRVKGLRQLQRYPRCERMENLEKELLNWKLLMQQFGSTMDEEHAFVLLCEFVPKQLEDELIRQNISSFKAALDFIEDTLSRLNGDRLAEFEERRIQMTMSQKPPTPFVGNIGTGNEQDLVQQLVAALGQQSRPQPGRRPGTRTPPRTGGSPSPATWKGGACFECGGTDGHKREDCPVFKELSARPGGYPKDHKNEYTKWKEAQGLPAPGYRGRNPRGGPRPQVAAISQTTAAQQPQQPPVQLQQQPQQPPQTMTAATSATAQLQQDTKSILKTWCAILNVPDDDDEAAVCGIIAEDDDDGQLVASCSCACASGSDHLCAPCIRDQEFPILEALQAPDKKKHAMPRMVRPSQPQRHIKPLTTAKIAQIERKARRGELHLPPLAANEAWGLGDSGATIAVANHKKHFPGATTRPSEASKKGTTVSNADGTPLKPSGEFDVPFTTIAGHQRQVCFQDAPVMFPILYLGGIADADNRITLDTDGGEILHKPTGQIDTMIRRYGGLLVKDDSGSKPYAETK